MNSQPELPHAHRFLIETPCGPTVHAICKFCGLERDYVTVPEKTNQSMTIIPGSGRRW